MGVGKFSLEGQRIGPLFDRSTGVERIRSAAKEAIVDAANEFVDKAAQDVAGAGNFGRRWTTGFEIDQEDQGDAFFVTIMHRVPYFKVFTKQTVIKGNPLLWIPLSFAKDAQGVRARDFPGPLFRVNRKSGKAPLLMAPGKPAQAKYFGKESVTIPQKFHTFEIARDVFSRMGDYLRARLG